MNRIDFITETVEDIENKKRIIAAKNKKSLNDDLRNLIDKQEKQRNEGRQMGYLVGDNMTWTAVTTSSIATPYPYPGMVIHNTGLQMYLNSEDTLIRRPNGSTMTLEEALNLIGNNHNARQRPIEEEPDEIQDPGGRNVEPNEGTETLDPITHEETEDGWTLV